MSKLNAFIEVAKTHSVDLSLFNLPDDVVFKLSRIPVQDISKVYLARKSIDTIQSTNLVKYSFKVSNIDIKNHVIGFMTNINYQRDINRKTVELYKKSFDDGVINNIKTIVMHYDMQDSSSLDVVDIGNELSLVIVKSGFVAYVVDGQHNINALKETNSNFCFNEIKLIVTNTGYEDTCSVMGSYFVVMNSNKRVTTFDKLNAIGDQSARSSNSISHDFIKMLPSELNVNITDVKVMVSNFIDQTLHSLWEVYCREHSLECDGNAYDNNEFVAEMHEFILKFFKKFVDLGLYTPRKRLFKPYLGIKGIYTLLGRHLREYVATNTVNKLSDIIEHYHNSKLTQPEYEFHWNCIKRTDVINVPESVFSKTSFSNDSIGMNATLMAIKSQKLM